MSFMSFDYAMRAADAALQFQQNQGQNIKDTNARAREVGTGNAKRKDELVRNKIEAEYQSKSAEIKKDKAARLAQIAEERKKGAQLAQWLVGGGAMLGGMLDGIMDLTKKKDGQAPDAEQMGISNEAIDQGYATSFRIAGGTGNSEQGAIVAFDPNKGNFNLVGMNTTDGTVRGFVQMSASDMAASILDKVKDDPTKSALLGMIDQGPPPMFKREHFIEPGVGESGASAANSPVGRSASGGITLSPALRQELFGGPNGAPAGFFAEGSRVTSERHTTETGSVIEAGAAAGSDKGENMIAGLLNNPARLSTTYGPTAKNILGMLNNEKIQNGLQITKDTVAKTEQNFNDNKLLDGVGIGDVLHKAILKPLGTALPQFMEMAKVAKQYEEEHAQKLAEYEQAKKQAAAAREKLQKLESLLAAGSNS